MARRSRRQKSEINYSNLGKVDGLSDSDDYENIGQSNTKDDDSGDEFVAEVQQERQDEDMEDILEDHEDANSDDQISDIDIKQEKTTKSKISRRMEPMTPLYLKTSKMAMQVKPRYPSSLKERFKLFFGNYEKDYVAAVRQRIVWGSELFYPFKSAMAESEALTDALSNGNTPYLPRHHQKLRQYASIEENKKHFPPSDTTVNVRFGLEENSQTKLHLFDTTTVQDSLASIIYLGGTITSIAWAGGHDNPAEQYLAASILIYSDWDPLNIPVLSPDTASFGDAHSACTIFILKADTTRLEQKDSIQVLGSYTADYGPVHKLAWRPALNTKGNEVGVLAFATTDGKMRLISVDNTAHNFNQIEAPLIEYSVDSNITTFCWRTQNIITVGMANGYIAEFDLNDTSDDRFLPSYYLPVTSSSISSITSAFPDISDAIIVASTDGFLKVLDVKDLKRSKTAGGRTKHYIKSTEYCSQLKSFTALEDNVTMKIVPIRRMHTTFAGTGLTRHQGTITAISTSLLHPFVLSTGTDGSIRIGNSVRRVMVNSKKGHEFYKCAKIWQLTSNNKEGFFSFNKCVDAEKLEVNQPVDRQYLFPPSVMISSVTWCPNISAGSCFASGMACGYLRIDSLIEQE